MPKVAIEMEVEQAQELASTARTMVKKIDKLLEAYPPTKPGEVKRLDDRAKVLTKAAAAVEAALHKRALAESNVVKMAKK